MADIIVLGSLNMDLVAQVARLPQPGETLTGKGFETVPGGKGANQAVAAARLGCDVAMLGQVGDDAFGRSLKYKLDADRINTDAISTSSTAPSGTALIASAPDNNQIIVVPGANGEVGDTELQHLKRHLPSAKILLLQFEIPFATVHKAAQMAEAAGLTVIVDPAPATAPLPQAFCQHVSILTPNQTEAALLTGRSVTNPHEAIAAAQQLQQAGIEVVIVKLGPQGIACVTPAGSFTQPAFPVTAIDTVAAGDAFNGGLAAALCPSINKNAANNNLVTSALNPALRYANAVAALAVTSQGAQTAMPKKAAVEAFLSAQTHTYT